MPERSPLCDRDAQRAVMILESHLPKNGEVTSEYPTRQRLCPGCVVTEIRVADKMGYLVLGEYL